MNSLSGDKLSFNFEFDNYEDDDLDSEVFEGEECLPHRVTHTRGSCPSNIEREQEWFLKVRLPEALDDLKDLLEISLGCCGVSAGSSRNILTPSTRGK